MDRWIDELSSEQATIDVSIIIIIIVYRYMGDNKASRLWDGRQLILYIYDVFNEIKSAHT